MRKGTCVVILALLVLAAGCGGYGSSGSKSKSNEVTVTLDAQNRSGEAGTATLTKVGDKTKVVIDLQSKSATPISQPQPAHIHKGSCAKLNPTPEYPLTSVESGKSTTTVDEKLDELQKEDYAINVHKSAADLKTYVACGDIGKGGSSGGSGGGNGY
jgi:hypothetical protein